MAGLSASDVIRLGSLAWDVYKLGWGEEYSANQQYKEFGDDIKNLAQNLDNIRDVVQNAQKKWADSYYLIARSRPVSLQREWDLSSLEEIIGNYNGTVSDCKKLLEENYEFRNNRNPLYNIEWNVLVQPKVDQLRKRLESHNSKITILLKPLEIKLLLDIHQDLAQRIDSVHQSVLRLQGLLFPDLEQAILEQEHVPPIPLAVPTDMDRRFHIAAEKIYPDAGIPGRFPYKLGAEAFVFHFKQSTKNFTAGMFQSMRTPSSKQYLSLLKCVWIIERLRDSDEIRGLPEDSHWPGYIIQLHEDLSIECQRFTSSSTQRLMTPDISMMRSDNDFIIWPEENLADYISPHRDTSLEEVLNILLPKPTPFLDCTMIIYKLDRAKYRIVESVEDRSSTSSRREQEKLDIDLNILNYVPIYATPSTRQKPLQVRIDSGSSYTEPTFQNSKDIYRLQHLLTGYKVYERYDQSMVTVSFFVSGQKAPLTEHGRIQLWRPSEFGKVSRSNPSSETSSIAQSAQHSRSSLNTRNDNSPVARPPATPSLFNRTSRISLDSRNRKDPISSSSNSPTSLMRNEDASASRLSFRSISERARYRTTSIMTNSSSMSRSSVMSSTTTISTGNGKVANLHSKPSRPLLVIFLKSQDSSGRLAIAAIELDDETSVERQRCKCETASSKCPISCIERSGGCLKIQRWDADQGLKNWNLAKLGMQQRKEFPADAWKDIRRVSFCFDNREDRYKFCGSPCRCSHKTTKQLAVCVSLGHQGLLGEVKLIGSQRIRNYYREGEEAARTSIVKRNMFDPLQEDLDDCTRR